MKTLRIYLAGPLFNNGERMDNAYLASLLEDKGYKVYLPQKEVLLNGNVSIADKIDCFRQDYTAITESDIMIANLNGVDVDSGTASEIGIAVSLYLNQKGLLEKPFGYRTDFRTYLPTGKINNFVQGCLYQNKVFESAEDIIPLLEHYKNLAKNHTSYQTVAYM